MKGVISVDDCIRIFLEKMGSSTETDALKQMIEMDALIQELRLNVHSLLISKLPEGYLECTKYPGTSTRCNKCNACNRMDDKDFEDGMEYYKNIVERVIDEMFEVGDE